MIGRVKDYYFDDINDHNDDDFFSALYEDERDSLYQALDPKEMKKAAKAASKHIQEDSIPESDDSIETNDNETYY